MYNCALLTVLMFGSSPASIWILSAFSVYLPRMLVDRDPISMKIRESRCRSNTRTATWTCARVLWLETDRPADRSIPVHHLKSFLFSLLRSRVVGLSHLANLPLWSLLRIIIMSTASTNRKTCDQTYLEVTRSARTAESNGHLRFVASAGSVRNIKK